MGTFLPSATLDSSSIPTTTVTSAPVVNWSPSNTLNPVSPIVVPEVQIGPVNTPAYATNTPVTVSPVKPSAAAPAYTPSWFDWGVVNTPAYATNTPVTVSPVKPSAAAPTYTPSWFDWGVATNNPMYIAAGLGATPAAFTPQAMSNSWNSILPWSSLDMVTTMAPRLNYYDASATGTNDLMGTGTGPGRFAWPPLGGEVATLGGAGDPVYVKIQAAFAGKTLNTEAPEALARIISNQFPEVTPVKAPVYAELLIQNQKDWAAVTSESAPKSPASDAASWQPLAETILSSAEAVGKTRLQDLKSVQGKQGDQERRNVQTYLNELENLREALSSVTTQDQYQSWAREVRGLRQASGSWASVVDMGDQVISAAPSRWGFATTLKHADGTEETQWNMQLLLAAGSLGLGLASIWMQKQQDDDNWARQMELAKLNRQWAREDYAWQMDKQLEYNKELTEATSAPSAGPAANPSISLS